MFFVTILHVSIHSVQNSVTQVPLALRTKKGGKSKNRLLALGVQPYNSMSVNSFANEGWLSARTDSTVESSMYYLLSSIRLLVRCTFFSFILINTKPVPTRDQRQRLFSLQPYLRSLNIFIYRLTVVRLPPIVFHFKLAKSIEKILKWIL